MTDADLLDERRVLLLAVDPGVSAGALAACAWTPDGWTPPRFYHLSRHPQATIDLFTDRAPGDHGGVLRAVALVEKAGQYVRGNAVGGATVLARHCGHVEAAALFVAGERAYTAAPVQWMRELRELGGVPEDEWPSGIDANADTKTRKRLIRESAARLLGAEAVPVWAGDAAGLLAVLRARSERGTIGQGWRSLYAPDEGGGRAKRCRGRTGASRRRNARG